MVAYLGPLASFAGKQLAALGVWKAGSGALSKIVPKAKGLIDDAAKWVRGNPGAAGKGVVGTVTGTAVYTTISDAMSAVGIKDDQLQLILTGVGVLGAIAALGSLFDIQLGGGE